MVYSWYNSTFAWVRSKGQLSKKAGPSKSGWNSTTPTQKAETETEDVRILRLMPISLGF